MGRSGFIEGCIVRAKKHAPGAELNRFFGLYPSIVLKPPHLLFDPRQKPERLEMNSLDGLLQFNQTALTLHAERQKLIASNIANADTPGYKARDIDFAAALKDAQSSQSKVTPPGTKPLSSENQGPLGSQVMYRSAVQRSVDGNTVDVDVERAQFAENAVRYEAQTMFITNQIKQMMAAIQG
jgi:flagellar basal-body rod protein FlgB